MGGPGPDCDRVELTSVLFLEKKIDINRDDNLIRKFETQRIPKYAYGRGRKGRRVDDGGLLG